MSAETWRKACYCQYATASGPRLIMGKPTPTVEGFAIPVTWAHIACDECDTPWRKVAAPAGPTEDGHE